MGAIRSDVAFVVTVGKLWAQHHYQTWQRYRWERAVAKHQRRQRSLQIRNELEIAFATAIDQLIDEKQITEAEANYWRCKLVAVGLSDIRCTGKPYYHPVETNQKLLKLNLRQRLAVPKKKEKLDKATLRSKLVVLS